jgi:hypothetical protein
MLARAVWKSVGSRPSSSGRRGKLRRWRNFGLVQGSSNKGKHADVDVSGLDLRDDVGLKIRDQFGCVRVVVIDAIT